MPTTTPTVSRPQNRTEIRRSTLESFSRSLRAENKSPATIAHYLGCARQFLDYAQDQGFPALPSIRREHVELWLESLQARYRPASVRNRYNGLRLYFNWLLDEGDIRSNPMARIKRPAVDETEKDVVSVEDMRAVLTFLERKKRWRDLALVALLYDTGMRASEVTNALLEDLDMDAGVLTIPKTKARRIRTVHLSEALIALLDRYLRKERAGPEYLISGRNGKLRREGVYGIVRRAFRDAGVAPGRIIGAHDLRHTSATHSTGRLSVGAMQTLYGWSDSQMPRHYGRKALQVAAHEEHARHSPLVRALGEKRR